MKITYKNNPLTTVIELDEIEELKLWYNIKIKKMEQLLYDVHYTVYKEIVNIDRIKKISDPDFYLDEEDETESPLDKETNKMFQLLLNELKSNHVGDCTCVPASCMKCYAERLIGVDTLEGLDKHSADKIMMAFENDKTIDEAILEIENDDCIPTSNFDKWEEMGGYEQFIPRWKAENQEALDWLKKYKKEHLS